MVRRNGRAIWSGNSYKSQKYIESLSGGAKPNILLSGHDHKIFYMFYRNIHSYNCGTTKAQDPFMKSMNLSAHLGGWILDVYTKFLVREIEKLGYGIYWLRK